MKFSMGDTIKILTGKHEGLAGIVTLIIAGNKTKENKYLLHVEGVKKDEAVEVDYWCDESNGEKINGY